MSAAVTNRDLVAVVPASGSASRLSELPFSKALYPLPGSRGQKTLLETPLGRLVDSYGHAKVRRVVVVSRLGRSDLLEYTEKLSREGLPVAHVLTQGTPSVAHTVCRAGAFLKGADVILGFPDIVFEPLDMPQRLVARKLESGADIALGLVPTDRPDTCDTVDLDERNEVARIAIKSKAGFSHAWIFAVWSEPFSEVLADYVSTRHASETTGAELQLSDAIIAAQQAGLRVVGERFPDGRFLDLGTPDALLSASSFLSDNSDEPITTTG